MRFFDGFELTSELKPVFSYKLELFKFSFTIGSFIGITHLNAQ